MSEQELKAIVEAESRHALGYLADELSSDREDGWNAYLQQPYGNEIEGRSAVVSSDVQDTVEWIMPSLIRIFTAGESAVEFAPNGPEDEEGAAQATDYANYVWDRDNPGFLNFMTWFKDALLSKNAFIKVYWEKQDEWKREEYEDLDDNAFALLSADPEKEIIEHSEEIEQGMDGMPVLMHDAVVKWKEESGKICIEPVPADEILFSREAKDIQNCRYFAHRTKKTVSDLIEQFPNKRKEIEDLPDAAGGGSNTTEAIARSTVEEDSDVVASINGAMREVWVLESYIRVDYNDDGIAEMRKITTAGGSSVVLDNDEWEGPRPFAGLTPIIIPHRLVGLSIADLVKDLQKIKTAILRQYLDALYIGNNPRYEVDENNVVDPQEVMTSKPGGIIRKRNASQLMQPVATVDISNQALEGLNYVDQMRENRTGVSPRTHGLGANALHDTATGEQLMYSAAQARVELVARVFAETGVKDAFRLILWLSHKYQDKMRTVRLRKEWVQVNPSEWSEQYDMTVNVGLGNGDKTKQLQALDRIAAMQIKAVEMQGGANGPLVTMDNLHNTASKYVEAAELKTPELYFTDPKNAPPQQPRPDPKMLEAQAKLQMQQAEMQANQQMKQAEFQTNTQMAQIKAQADLQANQARAEQDFAIAKYRADLEAQTSQERMAAEFQLKREQMALEAELKREQMRWQVALGSEKNAVSASIKDVRPGGEVG
tara:strand:- start:2796 stop:4934 length:2139 start_codon:yes stop_codon:yes gene_type:complete